MVTAPEKKKRKEDARVIRTKANLVSTFKTMLAEKPFEDITINEVCTRANIRRATFYKSFSDKYTFLTYLVGSLRDDFDKSMPKEKHPDSSSAYYVEYIHAIVHFLEQNDKMVTNIVNSNVLPVLMEIIKEKNYLDTCDRLRHSVSKGMALPASVEVTAAMMTGAVANVLLKWVKNGKTMPVTTLISEVSSVIRTISPMPHTIIM